MLQSVTGGKRPRKTSHFESQKSPFNFHFNTSEKGCTQYSSSRHKKLFSTIQKMLKCCLAVIKSLSKEFPMVKKFLGGFTARAPLQDHSFQTPCLTFYSVIGKLSVWKEPPAERLATKGQCERSNVRPISPMYI